MTDFTDYKTEILEIEDWNDFAKEAISQNGFSSYIDATEEISNRLEELLQNSSDLGDLKSRLENFIVNRRKFIDYANDNFP